MVIKMVDTFYEWFPAEVFNANHVIIAMRSILEAQERAGMAPPEIEVEFYSTLLGKTASAPERKWEVRHD